MLSRVPIYYKLVFAFACVIAVIFVTSMMAYNRLNGVEAARNWSVHTVDVLTTVHHALDAMVDQETGVRGYLLTGDQTFLEPYYAGVSNFDLTIQDAKALTRDDPAQETRIDDLSALASTWHSTIAEREIALMATLATREQARALETSGAGRRQMNLIRAKVADIQAAESDLLAQRDAAQKQAFAAAYKIAIVGGIMSVLVAALMGVLLARSIAMPLGRITRALSAITDGDTNVEVPEVGRGDEVGVLAKTAQKFKDTVIEHRKIHAEMAHVGRLTTMGELVASIAHEINQPLAAIRTNAEVGLRWLSRSEPDLGEVGETMSSIVLDADRAKRTIETLHALTKNSGLKFDNFAINAAVEDVLALTRDELMRHHIVLHNELLPGRQLVCGDRVQLQQVLLNLVMNAIEAMNEATDPSKVLTISSERIEPDRVAIAVKDTGAGIDPDKANRIFDSFVTTKPNGMGMGLSICRSIIEAHGERLSAAPNTPHGAIFRFTLRTSPESQATPGQA